MPWAGPAFQGTDLQMTSNSRPTPRVGSALYASSCSSSHADSWDWAGLGTVVFGSHSRS